MPKWAAAVEAFLFLREVNYVICYQYLGRLQVQFGLPLMNDRLAEGSDSTVWSCAEEVGDYAQILRKRWARCGDACCSPTKR